MSGDYIYFYVCILKMYFTELIFTSLVFPPWATETDSYSVHLCVL